MTNFDKYNFSEKTKQFLEVLQFEQLTKVQDEVVNLMINKESVIAISETGTGKTHAFLLPIFENVDSKLDRVQAVIIAPTRELAIQLHDFAKVMNEVDKDLKIQLVVGGMDKSKLEERVENNPHIVIGTPGRINDLFIKEGILRLDQSDMIVLDEADMIFDFGFLVEVDEIISRLKDDIAISVFSATIPTQVNQFLNKYISQPKLIEIKHSKKFAPNITHTLIDAKHKSYQEELVSLIETFNPYVCLIFANTRVEASETAAYLRSHKYKVLEIHGDLSARERSRAMRDLKTNQYTYIVATDIAARGLDIDGITHVVSLGLPSDLDFYIHRSGRTGRSKRHGTSYVIYKKQDLNAIGTLRNNGLKFEFKRVVNKRLVNAKDIFAKRSKNYSQDVEIAKVLHRKNTKVKPGYKKKRQRAIAKIKQRQRREMIKQKIKEAQKERAKAKSLSDRKG